MDVNDMIRDEDLILQSSDGIVMNQTVHVTQNIQQLVAGMVPSVMSRRPSPREINLLKRKAKISSKDQTKGWPDDGDIEASHAQNITAHKGSCPGTFCKVLFFIYLAPSLLMLKFYCFTWRFYVN